MDKIIGYSFVAIVLFTAFFYFYEAEIFEAKITEGSANYALDVSLKAFFDYESMPEVVAVSNITTVNPTAKGWMLLIICLIGLPIMIGYRLATNDNRPKNEEQKTETNES